MSTINKSDATSTDEVAGQLLFWLQQAHQAMKIDITRAFTFAGKDISTEQFSVLSYLFQHGAATQSEISRATKRERASVSRILTGMENRKLIQRKSRDMRSNSVKLTKLGLDTYLVLAPISDRVGKETLASCSERDIDATIRLLKTIALAKSA